MSLLDDIPDGVLLGLDTMVWIYAIETHAVFGPTVHSLFRQRFNSGLNRAGTSILTLGELLVQPLATGRTDLADRYRLLLLPGPDLEVWDVTRALVEEAARLRARYRLRMMDALQLASAIIYRADLFLTNDAALRQVREIRVLILSDYIGSPAP